MNLQPMPWPPEGGLDPPFNGGGGIWNLMSFQSGLEQVSAGFELTDSQTMIVAAAVCLISLALVVYLIRCTAKALNWMVEFALKAGIALLVVVFAVAAASFLALWLARSAGLNHWIETPPGGDAPSAPPPVGYVDLQVDPVTGERVRVPRLSQAAQLESRHSWRTSAQGLLKNTLGEDLADAVFGGGGWAWIGVKYGSRIAANSVVHTAKGLVWGTVDLVGALFRSAADQGSPSSGSSATEEIREQTTPHSSAGGNSWDEAMRQWLGQDTARDRRPA